MKSKLFFGVICIQLVIVVVLFIKIQQKKGKVQGISVNPIDSKTIQKIPSGNLKYFYEPKANTTEVVEKSWLENKITYTFNKDSLNERFNYPINKERNTFRIITIGDSFTYGLYVSTPNNWTELLEVEMNKYKKCRNINTYEVINLGVHGYDTEYEVERYRLRGQKYNPDLIIWYVTNLSRITEKIKEISETLTISDELSEKNFDFNARWRISQERLLSIYGERGLMDYQVDKFVKFRRDYYQGPLLILTRNKYKEYIENSMKDKATYFFDTENVEDNKINHLLDGHFNERGHKAFAENVFSYLIKGKLISCE